MIESFAAGGWFVIVALFLVWEVVGLIDPEDGWPTFTDIVRSRIPRWLLAGFLGWLVYHFIVEVR